MTYRVHVNLFTDGEDTLYSLTTDLFAYSIEDVRHHVSKFRSLYPKCHIHVFVQHELSLKSEGLL